MNRNALEFGRQSAGEFLSNAQYRVETFNGRSCNVVVDSVLSQVLTVFFDIQDSLDSSDSSENVTELLAQLKERLISIRQQVMRQRIEKRKYLSQYPTNTLAHRALSQSADTILVYIDSLLTFASYSFEHCCLQEIHRMLMKFQSQVDEVEKKVNSFSPTNLNGVEIVPPKQTHIPPQRNKGDTPDHSAPKELPSIKLKNQKREKFVFARINQAFKALQPGCTQREIVAALQVLDFSFQRNGTHLNMFRGSFSVTVPQRIDDRNFLSSFKKQVMNVLLERNFKGANNT